MNQLRHVAFIGLPYPTPDDLLQTRRLLEWHLMEGNWRILVAESDGLRSQVEKWCLSRCPTIASQRAVLAQAERVVCISRPDVARLAVLRGREAWLIDNGRQIIPRPLKGLWSAA